MCIEGKVELAYTENEKPIIINKGETFLVPAIYSNLYLHPEKEAQLLEIYID